MKGNILLNGDYRPLFSGHETFTLRYGWLKKAADAVIARCEDEGNKSIFLDDSAITTFGVGKNMVKSMRHWSVACGIISEEAKTGQLSLTKLGQFLFNKTNGADPFLEHPSSTWLLHWNLCSGYTQKNLKTTWYWAFNCFNRTTFERRELVEGLLNLADKQGWERVSQMTVQRDVECFVRSYENRLGVDSAVEDNLDSIFSELGLIQGDRSKFTFMYGEKTSLAMEVFIYALLQYWDTQNQQNTLSYESVAHNIGSPGRVFLLDEFDLAERLIALEEITNGALAWSETAGLKQILRKKQITQEETFSLLDQLYRKKKTAGNDHAA